jgi:hypothetical protein
VFTREWLFSEAMPSLRSLQRGAVAALLVTTAVAVAACGGSGSSASTTGTTGTTSTSAAGAAGGANSAAMAKYTACLEQNGVTLPTFGAGGPGGGAGGGGQGGAPPTGTNAQGGARRLGGNPKFQKAVAACASLRPAGLRGGFGGRGGGANSAAFAAYRNCLTLHGVKASQLNFGGAGSTKPSAKVQKAMTACASLRPQGRAPSAPTTTTPTTTTS